MIETHPCAIPGCREACPKDHLMCITHWRMVPAALARQVPTWINRWRRAVARAARSRSDDRRSELQATAEVLRSVQQQAIDAVVQKLQRRDQQKQEGQNRLFSSP